MEAEAVEEQAVEAEAVEAGTGRGVLDLELLLEHAAAHAHLGEAAQRLHGRSQQVAPRQPQPQLQGWAVAIVRRQRRLQPGRAGEVGRDGARCGEIRRDRGRSSGRD